MNCNVHKLNLCFLKQETPNNPTFKFDTDISNDVFNYTIKNFNIGQTVVYGVGSGINIVNSNTIELQIPVDTMVLGSYTHELIWERNGVRRVVFQGMLKISETGEFCADCQTQSGEFTVNIVNDEVIVNIVLGNGNGGNSINDVEIIPFTYAADVNIKKSYYFYEAIDATTIIPTSVEDYLPVNNFIQSKIKKLNFEFKNFNLISGKNPILIIERYRHTRRKSSVIAGQNGNHKSQFIKPHNRINEILITSDKMLDLQFEQETYFAPIRYDINQPETVEFRTRGSKKSYQKLGYQIFQFRIKTDNGISKPLLKLKMVANIYFKNNDNNANLFFPNDDAPNKNNFINVGYKQI